MRTLATASFVLAVLILPVQAADELPRDLDKIEAALKAKPDDPMLHYRKCQALFAKGKEQEAVNHAAVAMEKFKAARKDLAWMLLGSIKTKKHRIDVHYNMGPEERAEKKDGIVRPYSFRVWTAGAEPKPVRIVDFELAYSDGEVLTAPVSEIHGDVHANFC